MTTRLRVHRKTVTGFTQLDVANREYHVAPETVTRSAGFKPARAAIRMQARCLRYDFKTTFRCGVS